MKNMASLVWVLSLLLAIQIASSSEAKPITPTFLTLITSDSFLETLKVFEKGEFNVKSNSSNESPKPLYVVSPSKAGVYPVLFFIQGTMIRNEYYSDVFEHIASHGFIVLAPQLWSNPLFMPSQQEEINLAATVINWLTSNLQKLVPKGVTPDLNKLAISGHSRGGKTAFALARGSNYSEIKLNLNISALIALDPVAGPSKNQRTEPYILNYEPNSLKLSMPITVIGTGLGNVTKYFFGFIPLGACAPNDVNHDQFFYECRECTHFVVKDYGHLDMLNKFFPITDPLALLANAARFICESNVYGSKGRMRRTVGGLMVAFFKAYFGGNPEDYEAILANPSVAPVKLDPVQKKTLAAAREYS